jgi:hypothetical protein
VRHADLARYRGRLGLETARRGKRVAPRTRIVVLCGVTMFDVAIMNIQNKIIAQWAVWTESLFSPNELNYES